MSLWLIGESVKYSQFSHGWMWQHQDSNCPTSPENSLDTLLLHPLNVVTFIKSEYCIRKSWKYLYVLCLSFAIHHVKNYDLYTHTHPHTQEKKTSLEHEHWIHSLFLLRSNSFSSILPSGPSNAKESSMSPACCYKEDKRPIKPAYSRQLQTTMALSSHRISKLTQEDSAKCNLDNEFVL